ncbi:MAG: T9SS type A sorting domain-containing protein [Bacteroidetes bacterium]|nr:T9SS type A sorting domain-containing protein [Bacteroidota bacterium]
MPKLIINNKLFMLVFSLFSLNTNCLAQFNNKVWAFGDSAGVSWANSSSLPINFISNLNCRNGTASISDSNGLICYAGLFNNTLPINVCIWNKYNTLMQNGDYNYGGVWYHVNLFIPDPGNDSILYMFGIGVTQSNPYGFYYSTINYKANNDSGIVIQKNVQLNNFPAFDALMAVQHGNGRDWWLIFQRWYAPNGLTPTNDFFIYSITPSGISQANVQSIGSTHSTNLGHLCFNSLGSQFANISIRGMIELYNFDRCEGNITSIVPIEQEVTAFPYPIYFSCAFSLDGSKLYVSEYSQTSAPSYLYQFDLNAANISASKTVIDSFVNPDIGINTLKLAPDSKIYLASADESLFWPYPDTITAYTTINNNLSVINYPDSLGAACDFQPFSFNLGTGRSYYGLPNNPNYELGAWVGSPCDTLTVGITENDEKEDVFFQAWYNPEWNMIHVNAAKLKGKIGMLRLFDVEGRVVYERKMEVIASGYFTGEIAVNGITAGVYIVSLVTEKDKVQGKILKY